jgi:transposase
MALSAEKRAKVVAYHDAKLNYDEIAVKVGVHEATVGRIIRQFKKTGNYTKKKQTGRPRKLSKMDSRQLVRLVHEDRRGNLEDFRKLMRADVSIATLRRELHRQGIHCRVARKKPFLTARHIAKRLEFARKYKDWTVEQWRKVLWTDEASFERGKSSRQAHAWRKKDEANKMECCAATFKSGRISVMVWGGIMHGKKTKLAVFEQGVKKTADYYRDLVYEGPLSELMETEDDFILMEDGAPIHRSNAPKFWRQDRGLVKLDDWPAQSPDLNPIENLWYRMKVAVTFKVHHEMMHDTFTEVIKDAWEALGPQHFDHLIDSMPRRIQAVINAKGGSTRW